LGAWALLGPSWALFPGCAEGDKPTIAGIYPLVN